MSNTVFIFGSDVKRCKDLGAILTDRYLVSILAEPVEEEPGATEKTKLGLEELQSGDRFAEFFVRLNGQTQLAKLPAELARLSLLTLPVEDILERILGISTEVLGDIAFVIVNDDSSSRLAAAYCPDQDCLIRVLLAAYNFKRETGAEALMAEVLRGGEALCLDNLRRLEWTQEAQQFIERHDLTSVIAAPIRSGNRILGAFVSVSTGKRVFSRGDVTMASEFSESVAIALEGSARQAIEPLNSDGE